MKKPLLIVIFLFGIIFYNQAQQVVKVGAFNFYPGIFKGTNGEVKGFYVEALKELEEKENIKFVYLYGSWSEGLERLQKGDVDLLTSVAFTEDRAKVMDFSVTPLLTVWGEVYIKQSSHINGILDLKNKSIAIMRADMNGRHLQELTKKLSINCTYIETSDFEEVFQLVESSKVDAGVVNNTFGVPKYSEFGLRSSGIVFNPFDIYFTVKKGENGRMLALLDKYLHDWQHDNRSVYNLERQKWTHGTIGSIVVFPDWLQEFLFSSIFAFIGLVFFIVFLRYKIKVATVKVQKSEALFKIFMENIPAFVYIKDRDLKHVYVNKMVNSVANLQVEQNPKSAGAIFDREVTEMVECADRKILESETNELNIQYCCRINGQKTWLNDYKFSLNLPNEEKSIGGIAYDITRLKETEQALLIAKEQAEESDRLKSAFLANMSHEIRTPMNGILGFAELLKEPGLTGEDQEEYIGIIERSGVRMLNIINDIIDISKIESGQMEVYIQRTIVNDQMEFVGTFFKPEAEKKGLKITLFNSLSAEESAIHTDREKLYAVLTNLVKNAIKYTESGIIELGYKIIARQGPGSKELDHGSEKQSNAETQSIGSVLFYVRDTGIGIPVDRQRAVFERFIQADISDKMAKQGAGLGLAISKSYVEMLGGEIWVESEEGKGSTFYFTLPYHRNHYELTIIKNDLQKNGDPHLPWINILIAEDDENSKRLLALNVKTIAKQIIFVGTGDAAVDVCRNHPDIEMILMDIQMPVMNGFEATRQIRQFNKDVVIIAQTAYALSGDREKALAAGCNDYISKPIIKAKLEELVQKYFKK